VVKYGFALVYEQVLSQARIQHRTVNTNEGRIVTDGFALVYEQVLSQARIQHRTVNTNEGRIVTWLRPGL